VSYHVYNNVVSWLLAIDLGDFITILTVLAVVRHICLSHYSRYGNPRPVFQF